MGVGLKDAFLPTIPVILEKLAFISLIERPMSLEKMLLIELKSKSRTLKTQFAEINTPQKLIDLGVAPGLVGSIESTW